VSSYGLFQIKNAGGGYFGFPFLFGLFCYGAGFVIWIIILKLNPLSTAFPIAASSLIIATQLVGYFALGEKFSSLKLVAILLVLSGIVLFYLDGRKG
jgi:multidrug transporter EmrE-like cation transporter